MDRNQLVKEISKGVRFHLEQQVSTIRDDIKRGLKKKDIKISNLNMEICEMQYIKDEEDTLKAKIKELENANSKLLNTRGNDSQLKARVKELEAANAKLSASNKEFESLLEKEFASSGDSKSSSCKQCRLKDEKIVEMKNELKKVKQNLTQRRNEVRDLKENLQKKDDIIKMKEDKIETLLKEYDYLNEQFDTPGKRGNKHGRSDRTRRNSSYAKSSLSPKRRRSTRAKEAHDDDDKENTSPRQFSDRNFLEALSIMRNRPLEEYHDGNGNSNSRKRKSSPLEEQSLKTRARVLKRNKKSR